MKLKLVDGLVVAAVVVIFLLARMFAEEPKPVSPITPEEEIEIIAAERDQLRAEQALEAARTRLRNLGSAVYSSRKIDGTQYSLCEGPQLPECSDVKPGRIALRPVPKKKQEAEKK